LAVIVFIAVLYWAVFLREYFMGVVTKVMDGAGFFMPIIVFAIFVLFGTNYHVNQYWGCLFYEVH
jgi:hypothetical protein